MRAIMMVGLLIVMLIVGILTIQNMGAGSGDGEAATQVREYTDQAEDAAQAVEEKMQGLKDQLNPSD